MAKREDKNIIDKTINKEYKYFSLILCIFFCIFYLIVPLIPDVQITRPKLLVAEIIIFSALTSFLFLTIIYNTIFFRRSLIIIPFFIFSIYILLYYILSSEKMVGLSELKRWILGLMVLHLISVIDVKHQKWIFGCWIIGSGLAILYGYLQHTGGFWRVDVPKMHRVMSMFGNPIFFAVHIVNFIPLVVGYLVLKKGFFRIVFLCFLILCLITLYYTQTRGAFVGLFVSFLFFIFLNIKSLRNKLFLISSLLVITLIFVLFTKNIWSRQQAHLLIWRDTLKMWQTKPIFGVGLGKFHTEFIKFASKELRDIWPEKQFIINDAHNEYVQLLAEIGVIGFFIYIAANVFFFYKAIKIYNKFEKEDKIIVSSLLSGIIAVSVQNIFSVDMRFIISSLFLFLSIGLCVARIERIAGINLFFDKIYIKMILLIVISYILGLIVIKGRPFEIRLFSIINFSTRGIYTVVADEGNGILQQLLRPYIAQYKLKQQPDFFDEKVLDKDKTLNELIELRNKFPDKAIIYEKIAWIYAKEKMFKEAVENYLKAIELNPNSFAALNNLGNIMFLQNRKKEAINFYRRSLDINPQQIDSRINLGILYYYEGQLDKAIVEIEKVLTIDPKNEKAIVLLKKMRE